MTGQTKPFNRAVLTFVFCIIFPLNIFSAVLKTGDIIFQSSKSAQSTAIELATHSKYSHMGMLIVAGDKVLVFHAVNPVKITPFKEWVSSGSGGHYVVKRPAKSFGPGDNGALTKFINSMAGKPYDKYFGWGDDKIYCSELVWKAYKRVLNYELCKLRKLRDFDLSSQAVKNLMKKRYGDKVPLDEPVVAPSDIFDSKELILIEEK